MNIQKINLDTRSITNSNVLNAHIPATGDKLISRQMWINIKYDVLFEVSEPIDFTPYRHICLRDFAFQRCIESASVTANNKTIHTPLEHIMNPLVKSVKQEDLTRYGGECGATQVSLSSFSGEAFNYYTDIANPHNRLYSGYHIIYADQDTNTITVSVDIFEPLGFISPFLNPWEVKEGETTGIAGSLDMRLNLKNFTTSTQIPENNGLITSVFTSNNTLLVNSVKTIRNISASLSYRLLNKSSTLPMTIDDYNTYFIAVSAINGETLLATTDIIEFVNLPRPAKKIIFHRPSFLHQNGDVSRSNSSVSITSVNLTINDTSDLYTNLADRDLARFSMEGGILYRDFREEPINLTSGTEFFTITPDPNDEPILGVGGSITTKPYGPNYAPLYTVMVAVL